MTTYRPERRSSSDDVSEKSGGTSPVFIDEKVPPLGVPILNPSSGLWARWKQPSPDLDSIATQPSVFDEPITLEAYRPPPQVGIHTLNYLSTSCLHQYENTHRFDPLARWTWREEKVEALLSPGI
jgi:hypothetical protein